MHSNSKQLWRDVQVFDGQALLDEAMTEKAESSTEWFAGRRTD